MESQKEEVITDEEKEILQEIMNVAFGQAASDLTEVIDVQVILSIPYVQILSASNIPDYIKSEITTYSKISIVEQNFLGKFSGHAVMIFPADSGKEIITLFEQDSTPSFESDPIDMMGRETLMEVGNIVMGAVIGKLSELLKDTVTYSPPKLVVENHPCDAIPENDFDSENAAIVLKTDFTFDEGNVSGFLFLVTRNESIGWLKKALHIFLDEYEG